MVIIRCQFIPQAWVNGYAIEVDSPQGVAIWFMDVDNLPPPGSYDSDGLRFAPEAPQWVKDWAGPFEVEFDID